MSFYHFRCLPTFPYLVFNACIRSIAFFVLLVEAFTDISLATWSIIKVKYDISITIACEAWFPLWSLGNVFFGQESFHCLIIISSFRELERAKGNFPVQGNFSCVETQFKVAGSVRFKNWGKCKYHLQKVIMDISKKNEIKVMHRIRFRVSDTVDG